MDTTVPFGTAGIEDDDDGNGGGDCDDDDDFGRGGCDTSVAPCFGRIDVGLVAATMSTFC